MNVTSNRRRLVRRLSWPLNLGLVLGLLLSLVPLNATAGEPLAQTGGASPTAQCGTPPPLLQEYVDSSSGFTMRYPDGWSWRPRSDALPGTRSDVVWFGPTALPSAGDVTCILTVRTAMHYFLIDTSLEEMRDATAMLEIASLVARYLQAQNAGPSGENVNVPAPIPNIGIPRFWSGFRRGLWGAERLTLPSGHAYYREIGSGPVQDLRRNERQGNVERFVIAVSPRAMLEVVAEFTTPEYERGFGRLARQMVETITLWDAVSPNPGPTGQSVAAPAPDDPCQAVILAFGAEARPMVTQTRGGPGPERLRPQPFLDRSAVTQRMEMRGWAFATDGGTGEGCDQTVEQMAVFLDPPTDDIAPASDTISVYNLPSPEAPLPEVGFYLNWRIPANLFGQRVVYIAARLSSGRWAWITRQINIAPPISVEIDVNPPQVEVGELVAVVMRVWNNTQNRIEQVRPILYPQQGPGAVVPQAGPEARQEGPSGCELANPPASARQVFVPTPVAGLSGTGGLGSSGQGRTRRGEPASITLEPMIPREAGQSTNNCALFQWSFTALRSGPISFTGTAEGRLAGGSQRLLSRLEQPLAAVTLREPLAQAAGETVVSAPVSTATDVQVRAAELTGTPDLGVGADGVRVAGATVLPLLDNPRALHLLVAIQNRSFGTLYNVRADFGFRGVPAIPVGFSVFNEEGPAIDAPAVGYVVTGPACTPPQQLGGLNLEPRLPRLGPRSIADLVNQPTLGNIQRGASIPVLNGGECAVFVRTLELPADVELTQPLYAEGTITCQTRFGSSQNPGGEGSGGCAQLRISGGPFTVAGAQDLLSPSERRQLPEGAVFTPPGPVSPGSSLPLRDTAASLGVSGRTLQQALGSERGSRSVARADDPLDAELGQAQVVGPGGPITQPPPGAPGTGAPGTGAPGTGPPGTGGAPGPIAIPTPITNVPSAAGQAAGVAAGALGAITDCPPQTGPLQICLRAYPVANRDVRYFNVGDTVRLEMEVRNLGDVAVTNLRPGPVAANGATVGGGGLAFGRDPVSVAANDAAATAAAAAAGRGASTTQAAAAAAAAAEGVRAAAAGTSGVPSEGQCAIEVQPAGGIPNQIRQLSGPNPVTVGRLPRNGTARFTWDFLVQEMRGGPQLVFQTFAAGETREGPITSAAIQTDPLEKRVLCLFASLEATPATVPSGQIVNVTMRAENSTYFLRGTQQYTPGRYYFDAFPSELRPVIEEGAILEIEVLAGPNNAIVGAQNGVDLAPSEQTTFTWQYRVQGNGCFRLRGQLTARQQRVNAPFFSNTAETPRICVEGTVPRIYRER